MSKYPPEQPPPYGFQEGPPPQPPMTHQTTMVVVGSTGPPVGPNSQVMQCPSCHSQISTRVDTEAVTKTHLMALLLCVFGCWPCVCIPYCMDSCKNINHYCPKCNAFLGSYKS
ncbi:uncharacterized protein CBL_11677 [Carabus blaptoides fortunei]